MTAAGTSSTSTARAVHHADVPLVAMRGIYKRFPGVTALAGVDLELVRGEVHALLGENGAGKSTLMGIVTGMVRPDAGELYVDGSPVFLRSPRDALKLGIGMVHQQLVVSERHTALENIALGWAGLPFFPRPGRLRQAVAAAITSYGLDLDAILDAPMHTLSVGMRQKVEIARALVRGARVLILDEPTAVLSAQETEALFGLIRGFCDRGGGVVLISHKLDEVILLADRITVMRRGQRVAQHRAGEVDAAALAGEMIGREPGPAPAAGADSGPQAEPDIVVRLDKVSTAGELHQVSMHVRSGQVVGIAGVAGSGQRALAELLAGMRPPDQGTLELIGRERAGRACNPRAFAHAGVAHIPEDRHHTGVASSLSVAENLLLRSYRSGFSRRGVLSMTRAWAWARERITQFDIACPGPHTRAGTLSGGNLQKVILARELEGTPRLIVAAYPFRGLDVGAASGVRERLLGARARGAAIVLFSEDLDDIFAMADTIGVLFRGRLLGMVERTRATPAQVGLWMGGQDVDTSLDISPRTEALP